MSPGDPAEDLRRVDSQVTGFLRAKPLACYWEGGRLIVHNYHSGRRSFLPPLAAGILTYCSTWRSADDVCRRFREYPAGSLKTLLALLTRRTFLERSLDRCSRLNVFEDWADWMPDAALFHFGTKNVQYGETGAMLRELVRKARRNPPPSPLKRYPKARRTVLPPAQDASGLAKVLKERRTWRQFAGSASIALRDAATLLGLTWGVQRWAETRLGRAALKTSPSGGGRHPIEAYLLARRVEGLESGWYHYDPDSHELELVAPSGRARTPLSYLPRQIGYSRAPAVFIMSAVFARTRWAYKTPRAYRVVLLDAGHLGQTFCLVATALGLAPFCSAALADSRIERDLGLDGISESVIYACGVGVRPAGVEWAPWPDERPLPRVLPPASAKIKRKR